MSNLVAQRKVTLFFQQTSSREIIMTDAQTWGELQSQINGGIAKRRFVLRESKHTLQSAEALLPQGDFFIFVYPDESKGGAKKVAKKAKKTAKKAAKKTAKKSVKKSAKKVAKKAKPTKKVYGDVADVVQDVQVSKEKSESEELAELSREAGQVKTTFR